MRVVTIMALLFANLFAFSVDDVKTMRSVGVKIAFANERTAHKIPKDISPSRLMKINYLNFNETPLYFLPDWLFKLKNLSRLELRNTKIDVADLKKLGTLSKLDILDLSDNNLFTKSGSLVNIISNLNLNELYLSNTGGGNSDYANIGAIGSLVKLDLSYNSISDIEGLNLEKLKNLKVLKLNNNSIGGRLYPSELPQQSVEYLEFSHNQITRIKFNGDFPSLVQFKLFQENPRVKFDEEYNNIFLFPRLKQVAFGDNVTLPKSIMKRLGMKFQLLIPPKDICEKYGGFINNGECSILPSNKIENICHDFNTKLPDGKELEQYINDVDGSKYWTFDNLFWALSVLGKHDGSNPNGIMMNMFGSLMKTEKIKEKVNTHRNVRCVRAGE